MKRQVPLFVLLALCLSVSANLAPGVSRQAVIRELGEPLGTMHTRSREILMYDGGEIEIEQGIVVAVAPGFEQRAERRRHEREQEKLMRAKGYVRYQGAWLTPAQLAKRRRIEEQKIASSKPAVEIFAKGGRRMNLHNLLVPGKITIVDFYADWCGPCRRIAPHLEKLAYSNREIFLRKIDIVHWKTPVVKQFGINSVPNIRVFDRHGRQVGPPTSSYTRVLQLVQQAQ